MLFRPMRHPVAHAVLALLAISPVAIHAAEGQGNEDRIVVTGTHIKRIDQETASPVVVIDRTAIEGSGATTLLELLQLSPYNGAGSFNEAFTSGFTPGAAAFDLRGFGPERTLVLVNGKRQPMYPFGAGGSNAFVDLNSIPLATVKRVEILKDGASALYGSDAVAGVVNIITYDSFDGTEITVRGKTTEHGGADSKALSLLTGGEAGKFTWLVGVDASQREELLGQGRDYATSLYRDFGALGVADGRNSISDNGWQFNQNTGEFSYLGECDAANVVSPGFYHVDFANFPGSICAYDYASELQLLPETDRFSFSGKVAADFDWAKLTLSYGLVGVDTTSTTQLAPVLTQADMVNGVPFIVLRRIAEIGLPTIETESRSQHLAMDWQWTLASYDMQFSAYQNKNEVDETLSEGWLYLADEVAPGQFQSRLQTDLDNGALSLRNELTPAQIDQYSQSFWHYGESTVTAQEFRLSGPLLDTTLGPIWIAAGLEHREEEFLDDSELAILQSRVSGYGTSGAAGERDLNAAYVETAIPLSDALELSLSIRQDDYSDFGSSTNPKVGLRLSPRDNWLFRISWGTGFRAPGLHQLYTNLNVGSAGTLQYVQSGNPELEPEESESIVVGILIEPDNGSEFSLDLWSIKVDNIITNLGASTIEQLCDGGSAMPAFCAGRVLQAGEVFTAWNGATYTATDVTYNDSFLNLAGRDAFGVDLGFGFRFHTVGQGLLKWQTEISRLLNIEEEPYPDGGIRELEGNSANPQWRAKTTVHWQGSVVTHFLGLQYVGGWDVVDNEGEAVYEVDDYLQLDYQFGYGVTANQRVVLGVQNLTDEEPPVSAFSWPFFDRRLYSPLGRSVSLEWQGRF